MRSINAKFIALHLQEVGGKTYEKSLEYVQEFIKILCESEQLSEYNKIRVFLDEDFNSAEHFTVSLTKNRIDMHECDSTDTIDSFLGSWQPVLHSSINRRCKDLELCDTQF